MSSYVPVLIIHTFDDLVRLVFVKDCQAKRHFDEENIHAGLQRGTHSDIILTNILLEYKIKKISIEGHTEVMQTVRLLYRGREKYG